MDLVPIKLWCFLLFVLATWCCRHQNGILCFFYILSKFHLSAENPKSKKQPAVPWQSLPLWTVRSTLFFGWPVCHVPRVTRNGRVGERNPIQFAFKIGALWNNKRAKTQPSFEIYTSSNFALQFLQPTTADKNVHSRVRRTWKCIYLVGKKTYKILYNVWETVLQKRVLERVAYRTVYVWKNSH